MSVPTYLLQIFPLATVQDSVYQALWEAVPVGKFYQVGAYIVPFASLPANFMLITDAWDKTVTVTCNDNIVFRGVPLATGRLGQAPTDPQGFHMEVDLALPMQKGVNLLTVSVEGTPQTSYVTVVASNIAPLFLSYASNFFENIVYPVQQQQFSLLSPWSVKAVENLIRFQADIPDLRQPRTHAIKMIMHAMMGYSGTTRGVLDFATALTYNTPLIRIPTTADFPGFDYRLHLAQDIYSGHEFHTWLPSMGKARWLAFARLMQNLPEARRLLFMSEPLVDVMSLTTNRLEQHVFTQGDSGLGPDLANIIAALPPLPIAVHPSKSVERSFGSYFYRYRLGRKVQYPLGIHVLGSRPRQMGPIQAAITFSGMVTDTESVAAPTSVVANHWSVSPSSATPVAVVRLQDTDLSYIAHTKGGSATQTYRFDVSAVPIDAIVRQVDVSVVVRGLGQAPKLSIIATRAMRTQDLAIRVPVPPAYTSVNATLFTDPVTGLAPTVAQVAAMAFGVRDDSTGNSLLRVTEISVTVTWTAPVLLSVMDTNFSMVLPEGTTASAAATALATKLNRVANDLYLTVTSTPPEVDIALASPSRDGAVIQLQQVSMPPGLSVAFTELAGHPLCTNDGLDVWAMFPHDPTVATLTSQTALREFDRFPGDVYTASSLTWAITAGDFSCSDLGRYLTVQGTASSNGTYLITNFVSGTTIQTATGPAANETFVAGTFLIFPADYVQTSTFQPELGFWGHPITSTRFGGSMQLSSLSPPTGAPALLGTMSGFFRQGQIRVPGPQARILTETLTDYSVNLPTPADQGIPADSVVIQIVATGAEMVSIPDTLGAQDNIGIVISC